MKMEEPLRADLTLLPSVEAVLSDPRLSDLSVEPRPIVRARVREILDSLRQEIRDGNWRPLDREEALSRVAREIRSGGSTSLSMRLRPVWNATGILLHTNMGRAVLPTEARRALLAVASGYSNLELDLESGRRASRLAAVRDLIPLLTGAEAGTAVNNCAAALFLAMAALGAGREVLVSRGQLVEIGGSFRLPDILEASGVRLREVGTTNRTRIGDYERAVTGETAVVLHAHKSNFRLVGFSEEPSLPELVALCAKANLTLVDDLGSGALRGNRDLFPDEPCIEDAIEAGADLVCVSTDKLLGVGQAGILAGKRAIVERLQKHPIARVVRLDKTLLATLEAGLRIHLQGVAEARRRIPLLRALSRSSEELAAAAVRASGFLRERLGERFEVASVEVRGEVGGGTLPGIEIPSHAVALRCADLAADPLAARLRAGEPPVIGRIQEDRLLLDLRAIQEEDLDGFLTDVARILSEGRGDE
jgi:L-seryl-tRNA(Ser) seleniumtransferase